MSTASFKDDPVRDGVLPVAATRTQQGVLNVNSSITIATSHAADPVDSMGPTRPSPLRPVSSAARSFVARTSRSLRRALLMAAGAILLSVCCAPGTVLAQGTRIALIDIGKVFRNHPRLQQAREDVRRESQEYEAYLRRERKRFEQMASELRSLKPGTSDFHTLEQRLAQSQAQVQVQMQLKSKELQEKTARAEYSAYQEVVQHVDRFCQQHGIHMVISYHSGPIDPDNPRSVTLALNRRVVYQKGLDITDAIIAQIRQTVPPTRPTNTRPIIPPR